MPMGFVPTEKPLNKMELGPFRLDYLLHTLIFLPWMFLVNLRAQSAKKILSEPFTLRSTFPLLTSYLIIGIIFATSAEGIQYWLPYRGFNIMDVLFNVLGVLIGAGLLAIWLYMNRKLKAQGSKALKV
jgi:glycopeptide antibiotics resistance protein